MVITRTPNKLAWPTLATWQALPTEAHEYGPSRRYIGLDMSVLTSFASAVLLRRKQGGTFYAQPYFWLPEGVAQEHGPYVAKLFYQWADLGYLMLTPGRVIDRELIQNWVVEICAELDPVAVALDRFYSADSIGTLSQTGTPIELLGGGFHVMDEPTRMLAELIDSGQLQHQHNPVFDWMYGNVTLKHDPQNKAKVDYAPKGQSVSGVNSLVLALAASLLD